VFSLVSPLTVAAGVAASGAAVWYMYGERAKEAGIKAKAAADEAKKAADTAWEGVKLAIPAQIGVLEGKMAGAQGLLDAAIAKRNAVTQQTSSAIAMSIGAEVEARRKEVSGYSAQIQQLRNEQAKQKDPVADAAAKRAKDAEAAILIQTRSAEDAWLATDLEIMSAHYHRIVEDKRLTDEEAGRLWIEMSKELDGVRYQDAAAANSKLAAANAKVAEEFQKNVQHNIGDVIYQGLQGKFNGIADMFKQMLLRMTADAAAARITVGLSGMFGGAGSATAGTAASGAGSASSMSAAIAAAAPYAMAAVAAFAVAKYGFGWGNSRENVGPQRMVGSIGSGGINAQNAQDWKVAGGWFVSDKTGTDFSAMTKAQNQALMDQSRAIRIVYDDLAFAMRDNSVKAKQWTADINDISGGMGDSLIPALRLFQRAGEDLSVTAKRLSNVFSTTNDFIVALGVNSQQAFGAYGLMSTANREKLIAAAGGEQAFSSGANSFMNSILPQSDQLKVSYDAVGAVFASLNKTGIYTKEAFAATVKEAVLLKDYDTVGKLLSVADAFAKITDSAKQTTDQLLSMVKANSFSTLVDYKRAQAQALGQSTGVNIEQNLASATASAGATMGLVTDANQIVNKQAALDKLNALTAASDDLINQIKAYASWHTSTGDAVAVALQKQYDTIIGPQLAAAKTTYQSFAVGTNYIPNDMLAQVHKGEEIKPAVFVDKDRQARDETNALLKRLIDEVSAARSENQSGQVSIAIGTSKTARILDKFDVEGMPDIRAAA
jgi:hypothetical protein